jgi:hypothetical protein
VTARTDERRSVPDVPSPAPVVIAIHGDDNLEPLIAGGFERACRCNTGLKAIAYWHGSASNSRDLARDLAHAERRLFHALAIQQQSFPDVYATAETVVTAGVLTRSRPRGCKARP